MCFIYDVTYVIRGTEELNRKIAEFDPEVLELISGPIVWTKKEGGRTAWTHNDYIIQVKLLFLANLLSEVKGSRLEPFILEIVGNKSLTVEIFDKWWRVERFTADDTFESIEEELKVEYLKLIAKTNDPMIDSWLEWLADKK